MRALLMRALCMNPGVAAGCTATIDTASSGRNAAPERALSEVAGGYGWRAACPPAPSCALLRVRAHGVRQAVVKGPALRAPLPDSGCKVGRQPGAPAARAPLALALPHLVVAGSLLSGPALRPFLLRSPSGALLLQISWLLPV